MIASTLRETRSTTISIRAFAFAFAGLAGILYIGAPLCAAESAGTNAVVKDTPVIQFETNFFDFGKLTAAGAVSGSFNFKNAGDAVLKVDPPVPSCGCTDAKVNPAALQPGESGEITYTIKLDRAMQGTQKHIKVHSNDPKTPYVQLTMQLDYTPLYELNPKMLRIALAPGKDQTTGSFLVTRTDGKPLDIERLIPSQKWISAAFDPSSESNAASACVNVTVHRPPNPTSIIAANVQLWASNHQMAPMQTLMLTGEIQRELTAVPPRVYWAIPDLGNSKTNYPAATLTRTVQLKSVLGNPFAVKSATTDIKGMSVVIAPKDSGKTCDLILKFDDIPRTFTKGNVTVETSLASVPKMEVPVMVTVPNFK